MTLQRYADRCLDRRGLLDEAELDVMAAAERRQPSTRPSFESYATLRIGPKSHLDVLVVRDTELGIIDRMIDLRLASLSRVNIDMVVVTPYEFSNTFSKSSFGYTVLAMEERIYAALPLRYGAALALQRRNRSRNRR